MHAMFRVVLVAAVTFAGMPLRASDLILQVERADALQYPLGLVRREVDVTLVLALGGDGSVKGGEFVSWNFLSGPKSDFFDRPEEQARAGTCEIIIQSTLEYGILESVRLSRRPRSPLYSH